jgi:hypothetical protein
MANDRTLETKLARRYDVPRALRAHIENQPILKAELGTDARRDALTSKATLSGPGLGAEADDVTLFTEDEKENKPSKSQARKIEETKTFWSGVGYFVFCATIVAAGLIASPANLIIAFAGLATYGLISGFAFLADKFFERKKLFPIFFTPWQIYKALRSVYQSGKSAWNWVVSHMPKGKPKTK